MKKAAILIVDDNPSNLKLVRILLELGDYDIRTAKDAKETLHVLQAFDPQLILMDIQLPVMNGLDLTRMLRNDPKYENVIILAITAYAMRGDEEKAIAAGCDGYISKPIDTRTLLDTISKHLRVGRNLIVESEER